MAWTTKTDPAPQGNFSRFIQSRPFVLTGQRGVDFPEAITVENPWALTTRSSTVLNTTNQNDPT